MFTSSVAHGQEFDADTTGDWDVATNWSGNNTPSTFARISATGRNNSIVTLDTVETLVFTGGNNGRFIFGQGGTGSSLTIVSGGALTTQGTQVHRIGQTSGFDLTIESGGALNVQNASITSDVGSTLRITGGDLDVGVDYLLGTNSAVEIVNSSATVDILDDFSISSTSTLDYTFDAGGVTSVDVGDVLTINNGATLVVDASGFTPGATTITLANFNSLANANEFAETIIAPTGFTADVVYNSNSLDLVLTAVAVPEPSSMLLLLAGSGWLVARRRRRSNTRARPASFPAP